MDDGAQRLSYKFQRLRERLRNAIAAGELAGKLPGERVLAEQFQVNAKTLSKALTDLAAEGLLERTIGRGTFVRGGVGPDGEAAVDGTPIGRWLVIADPDCQDDALCRAITLANADREIVTDVSTLRPSLVNQFSAVIDVHGVLPDATLRDLLLRSRRLVRVDAPPRTYATHAVMVDRPLSATLLTRELIRRGARTLALVGDDDRAGDETFAAVRATVRQLGDLVTVHATSTDDVVAAADRGEDVAFVCARAGDALATRSRLTAAGLVVPTAASVGCVGVLDPAEPFACSGHLVAAGQVAQAVAQMIADPQLIRPTTLWLAGAYVDRCTIRGDAECPDMAMADYG